MYQHNGFNCADSRKARYVLRCVKRSIVDSSGKVEEKEKSNPCGGNSNNVEKSQKNESKGNVNFKKELLSRYYKEKS